MKLRLASDLHMEFVRDELRYDLEKARQHLHRVIPPLPDDSDTVLLLAGDIDLAKMVAFTLDEMGQRFKHVLAIAGNHEHYKGSIGQTYDRILSRVDLEVIDQVHLLENSSFDVEDVRFLGTTLWADFDNFDPNTMMIARSRMNDFSGQIRFGPAAEPWKVKFEPKDAAGLFLKAADFLEKELKQAKAESKKVVVMTHHAPSYESSRGVFYNDELRGAYSSDLSDLMLDYNPELWVHGHLHESIDYRIGVTRIVCNPYGYYPDMLNGRYNPKLTLEV